MTLPFSKKKKKKVTVHKSTRWGIVFKSEVIFKHFYSKRIKCFTFLAETLTQNTITVSSLACIIRKASLSVI